MSDKLVPEKEATFVWGNGQVGTKVEQIGALFERGGGIFALTVEYLSSYSSENLKKQIVSREVSEILLPIAQTEYECQMRATNHLTQALPYEREFTPMVIA